MNITSTSQDKMEMILKQMGASIESIHGLLGYVRIVVNDTDIVYVYNINAKNQYYLQRIKPYPLGAGTFSTQKEVLKYIKTDIEVFKEVCEHNSFKKYIDVNYSTHLQAHDLEELFFNYHVTDKDIDSIVDSCNKTRALIQEVKNHSESRVKQ